MADLGRRPMPWGSNRGRETARPLDPLEIFASFSGPVLVLAAKIASLKRPGNRRAEGCIELNLFDAVYSGRRSGRRPSGQHGGAKVKLLQKSYETWSKVSRPCDLGFNMRTR